MSAPLFALFPVCFFLRSNLVEIRHMQKEKAICHPSGRREYIWWNLWNSDIRLTIV
jgi:hypothetical protein